VARDRIRHIFTYGTLMASAPGIRGAFERGRIVAKCRLIGSAVMRGRMLDTGPCPAVVLEAGSRAQVFGELWRLPDAHDERRELLDLLDGYEGCAPTSPEPHPYARFARRIRAPDGSRPTVWVYLWTAPTAGLPRIADGRWPPAARRRASRTVAREVREPA
jgi:gamma-glutamylcyclotransferase (GGCT)/AIG2-like uncharacterized protein YtfP